MILIEIDNSGLSGFRLTCDGNRLNKDTVSNGRRVAFLEKEGADERETWETFYNTNEFSASSYDMVRIHDGGLNVSHIVLNISGDLITM